MADSVLEPGYLVGHVKDADYFHIPVFLDFFDGTADGHVNIWQVRSTAAEPLIEVTSGPMSQFVAPLDCRITKFMVLEVVVAVIMAVLFIRLAKKVSSGDPPKGRFWNMLEAMLLFIRDEVVRPSIGKHDADRFVPFIWTVFFFVLGCNLSGMVPWAGSPTGAMGCTGILALITFITVIGAGMVKLGPVGFWLAQVPHMDLPLLLGIPIKFMIFWIEFFGLLIKHFVLSVRLLANMFAGHMVLAVLVAFVSAAWKAPLLIGIWGVTPASILGAAALSLLELFVAFLQAYIFAFLSSLFIGMAVHPH